ncbi:MAG: TlpA family protein disulfide reductase [Deltaproteobacteria bacterium]|nr:TlpA family protein disulfide reductase [Deltaproteobacteria bacterium]
MPSAPSPALGRVVALALPSHDGALVSLPLAGVRATLLDAFAPTCEPCREKVPALLARQGEIESAGGRLVLVSVLAEGESTDDARAALRSWGAEAPFLLDRGEALRRECGVDALPASVVLDAQGVVRWIAPAGAGADRVVAAARAVAQGGE